jgi:hypothetical protein
MLSGVSDGKRDRRFDGAVPEFPWIVGACVTILEALADSSGLHGYLRAFDGRFWGEFLVRKWVTNLRVEALSYVGSWWLAHGYAIRFGNLPDPMEVRVAALGALCSGVS